MRTLQLKIALILVVAIAAVVLVATAVTLVVVTSGEANRMIGPMARHIAVSREFYLANESGSRLPSPREWRTEIVAAAPSGSVRPDLTAALQTALAAEDVSELAQVTQADGGSEPVAGIQLQDGRWMLFPFPEPPDPPPQLLVALGAWLLIIVIGVVAVALVMARRVTRPFAILESAIASVGPDGLLPHTPEVGSGEARQTAASLNRLSDRLKSAMASRMRLVAAAGHDLRTPMTRMRLRAEFLGDDERTSWISDLDELEAIADSAIGLVREEGAGDDSLRVALDQLVGETAAELRDAGLDIAVTASTAATVLAGPLALKRAVRNLLTNAATHGGGGRVRLEAVNGTATIVIEDDGPGIPEEMMAQVFEPFFRANPGRTQTVRGAGLGLAIAREIIERFGGTIEIRNRPSGGLEQVVTLRLV